MKKITKILTLLIASAALFSCDPALYENLNEENRDESKQTILSPDEMAALTVEVQTDYNTKFDDLNVPDDTYKYQAYIKHEENGIIEISSVVSIIRVTNSISSITDARSYTKVTATSSAAKQTYCDNHPDSKVQWNGLNGSYTAIAQSQNEMEMMAGFTFILVQGHTLYTNSSRTRFYTKFTQSGDAYTLCLKKIN